MRYYVSECPKCGNIQTNQTTLMMDAVMKCIRCEKSTKVQKKIGKSMKIHLICDDEQRARWKVKELLGEI